MIVNAKNIAAAALLAAMAFSAPAAMADCEPGSIEGVKVEGLDLYRAKGGLMMLDMNLLLDQMKLGSNSQVTLRPALVSDTDTAYFRPVTVYGRNAYLKMERGSGLHVADAIDVKREKGPQNIAYSEAVPFAEWMNYSRLIVCEDRCGCGRFKDSACTPISEIDNRPAPFPLTVYITPNAEAEKNRDESGQAFVDFIVNKTNIVPTYRNNTVELAKIIKTIDLVKDDPFVTITNVNIHGFASPEGTYENNTRLATGRAAALKDYVRSLYDMPASVFTSEATPEDWDNLRILVANSDLKEKAELLAIIDDPNMDPDTKDHEMKRQFPSTYAFMLREWYPGLRHSDYKVSYVVRPLTIEEAKEVLETNPKNLSLNEMFLVAQTYEPGSKEFNRVFDIAVNIFPDDPTANLNAAITKINAGDLAAAEQYLAKAGDTPEATNARGVVALLQANYEKAGRLLRRADDLGVAQAKENLKILERAERVAKAAIER